MRSFKTLLLGTALAAGTSLGAMAAPLNGSFDITGQFRAANSSGTNVPFGDATAIDFCGNTTGTGCTGGFPSTGAFLVNQVTAGSNFGISAGDVGAVQDVVFNPFSGPIANFYTVGGLSFDLNTLTFDKSESTSGGSTFSFINLAGTGILKRSGFDDTAATFSFTGQTNGIDTVGTFSFSGASAATGGGPNPGPVPEPATLALFGAGLLGLGLVRRRKEQAKV